MEIIDTLSRFDSLQVWRRAWIKHDNDDTPPDGATPIALPAPLPASIVFPMKLARGAAR